jgi:hypothetical protein
MPPSRAYSHPPWLSDRQGLQTVVEPALQKNYPAIRIFGLSGRADVHIVRRKHGIELAFSAQTRPGATSSRFRLPGTDGQS